MFGGTFDPIHTAHLIVAREAADAFSLDRVLFIPAGNPPLKEARANFEDRFRMTELACAADPRFIVSRLEDGAVRRHDCIRSRLCVLARGISQAMHRRHPGGNLSIPARRTQTAHQVRRVQ